MNLTNRHLGILQRCVVDNTAFQWEEIATALGFEPNKIEMIKASKSNDIPKCLMEVLTEWLRRAKKTGDKPRTVQILYDVLVDRDFNVEAEELLKEIQKSTDLEIFM